MRNVEHCGSTLASGLLILSGAVSVCFNPFIMRNFYEKDTFMLYQYCYQEPEEYFDYCKILLDSS